MSPVDHIPSFIPPKKGEGFTNRELHERFGVSLQGGIRVSIKNRLIILISATFTDKMGQVEYEGDREDKENGILYYMGAGKYGDQKITRCNKSILDRGSGQGFRMFYFQKPKANNYVYRYEVKYDSYSCERGRDPNGKLRKVIIFKLRICR